MFLRTPPARRRWLVALASIAVLMLTPAAQARVYKGELWSPSNGRTLQFRVYTPPGYKKQGAVRYPVVYSLHGKNASPAQRARMYAPVLDAKTATGEIIPMIWVFPDAQRNSYYGDAFDGHKQVESHIVFELLPLVESQYNIVGGREGRALEGFSMGGFGAGLYAAKCAPLFSATLLQGAVLPNWPELLRKEPETALEMYFNIEANWLEHSVFEQSAANSAALALTVNYKMIIGDADAHWRENQRFSDYLSSLGVDTQLTWLAGVKHSNDAYLNDGSGLRFLSDHFSGNGLSNITVPVARPRGWAPASSALLLLLVWPARGCLTRASASC